MTKVLSSSRKSCKGALLSAAEKLFLEKGYQAVSTREIADAAGVNLGLIQYYFGSKANLFLETVQQLMDSNPCRQAGLLVEGASSCRVACARKLSEFILAYLEYLLRNDRPQPCRMVFREISGETAADPELYEALVNTVASDFSTPLQSTLVTIIKYVNERITDEDARYTACSILGQCVFYGLQRPSIERMWGHSISESPYFEEIGRHIAHFSLRALGVDEQIISETTKAVFVPKSEGDTL